MTKLRFLVAVVAGLVIVFAAVGGAYIWFTRAAAAPGPLQSPITVLIPPGSGLQAAARDIALAGVIEAPLLFELEARRTGQARSLKPGEYRFEAGISIDAALTKIVRREVVVHFVTIPEGLVAGEIRQILERAEGLMGPVTLPAAEDDLLPETYRYEWGDTRDAVVNRMRTARTALLNELWDARAPDLPLNTPEEAVILASIVEKETGIAGERPHVASVFINRLRRGMKLQSDPTIIYGLAQESGELGRPLTRADLEQPTAYNTYVIDGLPPTAICNPGRAALAAALMPEQSSDLYFVADGGGGHVFAATLDEHNRNVARWRHLQQNHSP